MAHKLLIPGSSRTGKIAKIAAVGDTAVKPHPGDKMKTVYVIDLDATPLEPADQVIREALESWDRVIAKIIAVLPESDEVA